MKRQRFSEGARTGSEDFRKQKCGVVAAIGEIPWWILGGVWYEFSRGAAIKPTVGDLKATGAYLSVIKHDNWKSSTNDVLMGKSLVKWWMFLPAMFDDTGGYIFKCPVSSPQLSEIALLKSPYHSYCEDGKNTPDTLLQEH